MREKRVRVFLEYRPGGPSPPSVSDIKSSVIFLVLHLLWRDEEEETCSIATADVVTIKKPAEKQL